MIIPHNHDCDTDGLHLITEETGYCRDMMMDFGLIGLFRDRIFNSDVDKERAFLLISGGVRFLWQIDGQEFSEGCSRTDVMNDDPVVLHVPGYVRVHIECLSDRAELAYQARTNPNAVPARIWHHEEFESVHFGDGVLDGTSRRLVRTVFDASTVPESAMVLGEVVNYPGRWSSYPPHRHPQPEIYHYRFFPEQGFGYSQEGDDVAVVRHGDTATIPPNVVHPQCAAPGYTMYYIWAIPHLDRARFGPDSREFDSDHAWLLPS